MKLLIVDDSVIIRKSVEAYLKGAGVTAIKSAKDGEEAIDIFNIMMPDYVTLDITLPGIEGIEVLKKIIKLKPDCKVMMLTSLNDPETEEKVKKIGAKMVLNKPFNKDKILNAFEKLKTL